MEIEALAWNNDGSLLFAGTLNKLYGYDPVAETLTLQADNQPGNSEGFEMRPDDLLMVTINELIRIYPYDPDRTILVKEDQILAPYEDIESQGWPESSTPPSVT